MTWRRSPVLCRAVPHHFTTTQGRIQDFLIRGTGNFLEFRTPESESGRDLTNYFIIFLLLFVTFLLRIFWKIFFMIIDLNLFQIFEDNNETINNITLILLL